MADAMPPFELHSNQTQKDGRLLTVPRFTMEFVDIERILPKIEVWAATMKNYFNNYDSYYTIPNWDGTNNTVSALPSYHLPKKIFDSVIWGKRHERYLAVYT